ncbi:MAG: polysaccharide deacetylase family protein [Bacteroidales bacterium]|nr:polysaccharide deacetylase family protein [Bacteroidales bacterium]
MHSSWFRKPIYKPLRWVIAISLIAGIAIGYFTDYGLYPFLLLLIIWIFFLIFSSFHIRSGVYIKITCAGNPNIRKVSITFDDGPGNATIEVLELLEKFNAKGTFFIVGKNAEKDPDTVKKIYKGKHTIGNHTLNHRSWFPIMSVKSIGNEILQTQKIIEKITGAPPLYFRPPYGITNPLIAKSLESFRFIIIGWSIRSLDTVIDEPDRIFRRIRKRIKPGSIILLHDSSEKVIKILEELLVYCKQQNLQPVSIDELLEDENEQN